MDYNKQEKQENLSIKDKKIYNEVLLNEGVKNLDFIIESEIEVVKELNFARTNPKEYAKILMEFRKSYDGLIRKEGGVNIKTKEGVGAVDEAIKFLLSVNPLKPLKISKGLTLAAKKRLNDLGPKGEIGHIGSDGSSPDSRMDLYGKWEYLCGENIDYGNYKPRDIVISLIVDDGVPNRGHRNNIFNSCFETVGVALGKHAVYNYMCVMDFAQEYKEK